MNPRSETFLIEQSLPRARLDAFLRTRFPEMSRGAIQRLIEQGQVRVNDQTVKSTHAPRAGEVVTVTWPDARAAEALPVVIPLNVIF